MTSKCKEKYGREWSKELTQITLCFFDDMPMGIVKHIGSNGYRRAVSQSCASTYAGIIPESEQNNKVFLFFMDKEVSYDCSYETVQDMVDDGWAID